jgi:hypothetical protein
MIFYGLLETPTSLRRFYAIRPSRRTTPFGKFAVFNGNGTFYKG